MEEKTDLLRIYSEDVESKGNKEVESHSDDSSTSIRSPPQALRIDPEREKNISARRAALEARSYTDESGASESVQVSECSAVMNSKEEESSEGRSDDDMTKGSSDSSEAPTIGEDTSKEEEPIPEEALSDDE